MIINQLLFFSNYSEALYMFALCFYYNRRGGLIGRKRAKEGKHIQSMSIEQSWVVEKSKNMENVCRNDQSA